MKARISIFSLALILSLGAGARSLTANRSVAHLDPVPLCPPDVPECTLGGGKP